MVDQANELVGKVAIVSGSSRNIGRATAIELAKAGASLVVNARESKDLCNEVGAEIEKTGGKAIACLANISDPDAVRAMVDAAVEAFGGVDILINNAGITRFVAHDDLDDLDDDLIDDIFRTNWRGAFACVRAMRPLLDAVDGGLVINISSIAGVTAMGSNIAYCASKAAMNSMTMSLARALAPGKSAPAPLAPSQNFSGCERSPSVVNIGARRSPYAR